MDNPANPQPKKKLWPEVLIHLLIMAGISLVLLFVLIYWLDIWTHHGERIMVPRVIGMTYNQAVEALSDEFDVVLQDSVYESGARPGQVIDQNPKDSSFVKSGRTIFLTINAFYPRTVAVPNLKDISLRQALTTLEGLGLKNYEVREVPSEYGNLVLSVSYNGKHLVPGTRLPLDAKLIIEVGKGAEDTEVLPDSLIQFAESQADAGSEPIEVTEPSPASAPSGNAPITPAHNTPDTDPEFFD